MGSDIETVEEAIGRAEGGPTVEELPGSDGGPGAGDSSSNGDPQPPGEDAIALVEMVTIGVVVGVSKMRGIEVDTRVMELTRLTDAEKDQLRPYAPYAAPYLHEISKHSEAFMAIVFCGLGALSIYGKMKTLSGIQLSQQMRPVDKATRKPPGEWVANPVEEVPPMEEI